MKKILLYLLIFLPSFCLKAQKPYPTLFEETKGKETPEYADVIAYFQTLSNDFEEVRIVEMGTIGSGKGISPVPSHRTVRETLTSHGSSCL